MSPRPGKVYLVGAGPGDTDLITERAKILVYNADVVVYDGLVSAEFMECWGCKEREQIYAGKKRHERGEPMSQDEINALLIERAQLGQTVVRLKGGDPFLFGRGGEEAEALRAAGIEFVVVPGVSAATAVPAYAGIPLTHRDVASSVVFIGTGQGADNGPADVDWAAAAGADTIVLFMAVKTLPEISSQLMAAGRSPSTPAAAIRWGTTAQQQVVVGTLADLHDKIEAVGLKPPALLIIGEVVRYREKLSWFDSSPWFGKTVLVFGGAHGDTFDSMSFHTEVTEHGGDYVHDRVTREVPLDPPLDPRGYRWVVFTSQRAVERGRRALIQSGRDMRDFAGVRIGAVGETTSQALHMRGLRPDLIPPASDQSGGGLARAMLAADPDLPGHSVLWPCAENPRAELRDILTAAGVNVVALPMYRTQSAEEQLAPLLARLRAGEIHVLTFYAPSQITALAEALGADAVEILHKAEVIAAIGPTTAAAIRALGIRVDAVAASPSSEALADAIVACYRSRPRT